jgi:hypothetical protein
VRVVVGPHEEPVSARLLTLLVAVDRFALEDFGYASRPGRIYRIYLRERIAGVRFPSEFEKGLSGDEQQFGGALAPFSEVVSGEEDRLPVIPAVELLPDLVQDGFLLARGRGED